MKAALWQFPPEDFDEWWSCVLDGCDTPECKTYAEYQTMAAALQADLERHGVEVVRVKMTVREMLTELRGTFETRLQNSMANRALIIGRRHCGAAGGVVFVCMASKAKTKAMFLHHSRAIPAGVCVA